jgi:hypothetical protein
MTLWHDVRLAARTWRRAPRIDPMTALRIE